MVGRDQYLMVDSRIMTSSHDSNYGAAREATREVCFLSLQFGLFVLFSNDV